MNAATALRGALARLESNEREALDSARRLARALLRDPSSQVRQAARDLLRGHGEDPPGALRWLILCLDADPACQVLIVEHSPTLAAAYATALTLDGFEVTLEDAVSKAADLVRAVAFDLVVTDTHVGEGDGCALLPLLPDTPVIVLTHYRADPLLQLECQALGAAAIYEKPLHPTRLVEAGRRVLELGPPPLGPRDADLAHSLALLENRRHLTARDHEAVLDGSATPPRRAAALAHLDVCPPCRRVHRAHALDATTNGS